MLGAAGALAAIGTSNPWRIPALLIAILAAIAAIRVLWPQRFPTRELRAIRETYLTSDRRFTELMLLDSGIGLVERMQTNLERRARWLRRAAALLVLSGMLHALGSIGALIGG